MAYDEITETLLCVDKELTGLLLSRSEPIGKNQETSMIELQRLISRVRIAIQIRRNELLSIT